MEKLFLFLFLSLYVINSYGYDAFGEYKSKKSRIREFLQNSSVIMITQDINLRGEKIVIRDAARMVFVKGKIKNGTLVGKEIEIYSSRKQIFDNCKFEGSWKVDTAYPEWFGAVNDGKKDCTKAIQSMFNFMYATGTYNCKFSKCRYDKDKFYLISKTIYIRNPVRIDGRESYISSRSLITFMENPKHHMYLTDGIGFHVIGQRSLKRKRTDICINVKIHGKPFYFSQLDNLYVHDCYISSFSDDKKTKGNLYTYWYGFQCDELSNAKFENIHIDQPSSNTYNSSDGIHLSGGCHDILIVNCYGQAGDDFIAMNTNENHSGDIYNIVIKNCTIGKNIPSVSGIRMYGCTRLSHAHGKPQLKISNVTIENCYIRTSLSPCLFFANNPDWQRNDTTSLKLCAQNVIIKNCDLQSQTLRDKRVSIWLGGTECLNVIIDGVTTSGDEQDRATLIGLQGFNELSKLSMRSCRQGNTPARISIEDGTNFIVAKTKEKGLMQMSKRTMEFKYKKGEQFSIIDGVLVEK